MLGHCAYVCVFVYGWAWHHLWRVCSNATSSAQGSQEANNCRNNIMHFSVIALINCYATDCPSLLYVRGADT